MGSDDLSFAVRNPGVQVASGQQLRAMKQEAQVRDQRLVASGEIPPESMLFLRPKRLKGSRIQWPDGSVLDDDAPA